MNNGTFEDFMKSNLPESSILKVIHKSIENLHSLRRSKSKSLPRSTPSPYQSISSRENLVKKYQRPSSNIINHIPKSFLNSGRTPETQSNTVSRCESPLIKRKNPRDKPKSEYFELIKSKVSKKISFSSDTKTKDPQEKPDSTAFFQQIMQNVTKDLKTLNENQSLIEKKTKSMGINLSQINSSHLRTQSEVQTIMSKLSELESSEIPENKNDQPVKVLQFIEKISKIESNYESFVDRSNENMKNMQKEMLDANHKIQDLKECNEILTELVTCLQKEPLITKKIVHDAETFMESPRYELGETISLEKLGPESIAGEFMKKREQLIAEKEKMEMEYRNIPHNSKSMANKKRKQALEMELSMNYSKLMSINGKIKKYLNK
ncbi:hypothetical protein SteCoe_89 [Stentor coeruleus]|uniref:Uncharacterized protein n=1 Tax=Stentor coeruleus TaxID=5963 RepID=A0A1R2D4Z9_9CILI|nr:hypothetical protein SteCoe_89 [Stentor coeruleus]